MRLLSNYPLGVDVFFDTFAIRFCFRCLARLALTHNTEMRTDPLHLLRQWDPHIAAKVLPAAAIVTTAHRLIRANTSSFRPTLPKGVPHGEERRWWLCPFPFPLRFSLNDHFRSVVLSNGYKTAPRINDGRNTGDFLCLM